MHQYNAVHLQREVSRLRNHLERITEVARDNQTVSCLVCAGKYSARLLAASVGEAGRAVFGDGL
jgi:hypothetical protein